MIFAAAVPFLTTGLVALRVLTDKRHILTKDSEGNVQLWDVLSGAPIQQLGQVGPSQQHSRVRGLNVPSTGLQVNSLHTIASRSLVRTAI